MTSKGGDEEEAVLVQRRGPVNRRATILESFGVSVRTENPALSRFLI